MGRAGSVIRRWVWHRIDGVLAGCSWQADARVCNECGRATRWSICGAPSTAERHIRPTMPKRQTCQATSTGLAATARPSPTTRWRLEKGRVPTSCSRTVPRSVRPCDEKDARHAARRKRLVTILKYRHPRMCPPPAGPLSSPCAAGTRTARRPRIRAAPPRRCTKRHYVCRAPWRCPRGTGQGTSVSAAGGGRSSLGAAAGVAPVTYLPRSARPRTRCSPRSY